jgi:hypothetical protein
LNELHQLLAYADDVNLLGGNIDTINKDIEISTDASNELDLEVNVEKTKYILVSSEQNSGQNLDMNTANRPFENVLQFNYF